MEKFDSFEKLKSVKEILEKIASLNLMEKRFSVSPVLSLRNICLQFTFKHGNLWQPGTNLPDNLVQGLLELCKPPAEEEKSLQLINWLLKVPNSSIRCLDMFSFSGLKEENFNDFFQLVLKNCPQLEHLSAPCPLMPTASLEQTEQLTKSIVASWTNLKSLDLMGFYVTDSAIKLISKRLPNLEKINLCLRKEKFTKAGAQSVVQMKKLTDLELYVLNYDEHKTFFLQVLIHIPGHNLSIQRLHLNLHADSPYLATDFVDAFGKLFPGRRLTLKHVTAIEPLHFMWPQNLHIDTLIVQNTVDYSPMGLRYLLNIPPGVSELNLGNFAKPDSMYKILERLGPHLKKLHLSESFKGARTRQNTTLNLYKVLSLCPNLEHFSSSCLMPLEKEPKYNLTPQNFAKMKSFELHGVCNLLDFQSMKIFHEIFQMVIKGSKCYKVLTLHNGIMLRAIFEFVKNNPDCLTEVEVFNVVAVGGYGEAEEIHICNISKLLMLRSPYLRHIEIHGLDGDFLPNWFLALAVNLGVEVDGSGSYDCFGNPFLNPVHKFANESNGRDMSDPNCDEGCCSWFPKYFPGIALLRSIHPREVDEDSDEDDGVDYSDYY